MWDVFISHASEDKDSIARPLALALQTHGLTTWLDAEEMFGHEPLDQRIEDGLRSSKIIVLILSSSFLSKEWTTREMMLALELETPQKCVVVPLMHNLDDDDIDQIPPKLRNRPGVSTKDSFETAFVRLVATIRSIRGEALTGWIHFLPDGWPLRHMFDSWLSEADRCGAIDQPSIAWPNELFVCINQTERFAEKLALATPDPNRTGWFDFQGMKLRGIDIQACQSAPIIVRKMMKLCPIRLACLAESLKGCGGYEYAVYSGRTFLYLALKEICRAVNTGAQIAGCPLPATTTLDDIKAISDIRSGNGRIGSVLVTADPVAEAIKPYLSGGNELYVIGLVDHLKYLQSNTDGATWMDFFEDYLVPQVELRLLMFDIRTTVVHSCNSTSWKFRRFRDENGCNL